MAIDRDEPRKLADEDGIGNLCWSPRSDFVVFAKWTVVLKKVSVEQLIWSDRKGVKLGPVGQPQTRVRAPRLSPDASRIAAQGWDDPPQMDIWIHDVTRGSKTRLTSHPASEHDARWTPQGNMMTFTSLRDGTADIFIQSADGSGEPKALVATPLNDSGSDWSDDGKYMIYSTCSRGQCDGLVPETQGRVSGLRSIAIHPGSFRRVRSRLFTRWTVRRLYGKRLRQEPDFVRRFPDGTGKTLVSMRGGTQPRWRKDGNELFYVEDVIERSLREQLGEPGRNPPDRYMVT